jgi:hypothetical protein
VADFLLAILAALFFVSPGLIGAAILIQSARRPKSKATVILKGLLGAFLMWFQVALFFWTVNFRSAFSPGEAHYGFANVAQILVFFGVVAYFAIAFVRLNNTKKDR